MTASFCISQTGTVLSTGRAKGWMAMTFMEGVLLYGATLSLLGGVLAVTVHYFRNPREVGRTNLIRHLEELGDHVDRRSHD